MGGGVSPRCIRQNRATPAGWQVCGVALRADHFSAYLHPFREKLRGRGWGLLHEAIASAYYYICEALVNMETSPDTPGWEF